MYVHQFFLDCCKHEDDPVRRKQLRGLAFGHGGLLLCRGIVWYLCLGSTEFKVPTTYTSTAHDDLTKLLWPQQITLDYTVKKTDKVRSIEEFIMATIQPLAMAQTVSTVIIIAIMLKTLTSIQYSEAGQVQSICMLKSSDDLINRFTLQSLKHLVCR